MIRRSSLFSNQHKDWQNTWHNSRQVTLFEFPGPEASDVSLLVTWSSTHVFGRFYLAFSTKQTSRGNSPLLLLALYSMMASMMLLNCLFAMVFAAAALNILNIVGVVRSSSSCPVFDGEQVGAYSMCDMWQDIRSLFSFALGALFCSILQNYSEGEEALSTASFEINEPKQRQLSACLL